ncbi:MAG: phasin family protein [Pseudomonadota bacterium]
MSTTRKTTAKTAETTEAIFNQTTLNEGVERMTKGMSQFGTFTQENTEAMMQAASVVAKGFEKVITENTEFAKAQFDTSSEKVQTLTKAKTPQEFFEAQSEFMRSAMETQISQMNKVSDMMIATAKDAAQPLSKRYSAMVELMQQR